MSLDTITFRRHKAAIRMAGAGDPMTVNADHWKAMSAEQRLELRGDALAAGTSIDNEDPCATDSSATS